MRDESGSIRTSIQGQSGGEVAGAGERGVGSGCARSWYWSGDPEALARMVQVCAQLRVLGLGLGYQFGQSGHTGSFSYFVRQLAAGNSFDARRSVTPSTQPSYGSRSIPSLGAPMHSSQTSVLFASAGSARAVTTVCAAHVVALSPCVANRLATSRCIESVARPPSPASHHLTSAYIGPIARPPWQRLAALPCLARLTRHSSGPPTATAQFQLQGLLHLSSDIWP